MVNAFQVNASFILFTVKITVKASSVLDFSSEKGFMKNFRRFTRKHQQTKEKNKEKIKGKLI